MISAVLPIMSELIGQTPDCFQNREYLVVSIISTFKRVERRV